MAAKGKTLKGVVGVGVAGLLLTYVPQFEGVILRGYKDPIGIVTACAGHTATAVLGKPYTHEQCMQLLEQDLIAHAEPVLACTPVLKGKTGPLAAATSLAFTIGGPKYCGSTAARRFNAGDIAGGCRALEMWNKAGGKVLPGLVKRRATERAICEGKF